MAERSAVDRFLEELRDRELGLCDAVGNVPRL